MGRALAQPAAHPPLSLLPDLDEAATERFLFFAGLDLWRNSGTIYGGMLWSPQGLRQDGLTLKLLYAGGFYLYQSGPRRILGAHDMLAVLPGWRFSQQDLSLGETSLGQLEGMIYAGPDVQYHRSFPHDPGNRLLGANIGVRAGLDLWWEPMERIMLTTSLSGSTVGENFSVRLAGGWRMLDSFWIGPEIEASGDHLYQQFRIGAHVTALKFWKLEWAFSAGYVQDNTHRSGVYGRLGFWMRR